VGAKPVGEALADRGAAGLSEEPLGVGGVGLVAQGGGGVIDRLVAVALVPGVG